MTAYTSISFEVRDHAGWNEGLESQIDSELRAIATMAASEDAREAIGAFNEKRTPVFRGR